MKNNKGFSLVELIVVIAIMAILAAVAIPTFATFINKANVASDVDFINNAEYAAELASATEAKDVTAVSVKVEDKKAVEIIVTLGTGDAASTVSVVKADATANNVTDLEKEVASMIDWEYAFKSVKTNGTYKLTADGKGLE